ncbi:cytochrome P450 (plasmid) [Nonomuraea sp. NBC_00507]|uniref:cytochrome P450 n=1 Tax=Nonomuraea sp. NBC_00507 TaxID=2976002 RepID=UPI002E198BA1
MIAYNPNDPVTQADPFGIYQQLRDQAPLYHRSKAPEFWALSRHADVAAALPDFRRYSSDHGPALEQWAPDARKSMSFVAMDPPDQHRMRTLISRGFTPGRVRQLEPRVRELTRMYLEPALERGTFDFVEDLAAKIPMDVIGELIGVPRADRAALLQLAQQVMTRDDVTGRLTLAVRDANAKLAHYYLELIKDRRRHPREDLASALLKAEIDGDRLSDGDVVATLMLLGIAGVETTVRLLGTAWRLAWQHPDQRAAAFADVGSWVEETLRFDGPSQYTARRVTRSVQLHGREVPEGAPLLLLLAAANRDERVFPEADKFIVGRDTTHVLAFGLGSHFCLGAPLARLEATTVLRELVAAVEPDYDINLEGAVWARSPIVRGHSRLPTTIKPRERLM